MRATGGDAACPRDHIPEGRAHKSPEDHGSINGGGRDDAAAQRLRNMQPKEQEGDEVEESGPCHSHLRPEHTGGHNRRDGIGRIMEAVDEVKQQGQCNQAHKQRQRDRDNVHGLGSSDVLDHDAMHFVCHILQAVHHAFEVVQDFERNPEIQCLGRAHGLEKTASGSVIPVVRLTFDFGYLFCKAADLSRIGSRLSAAKE